jgi:hypothetical protein
MLDKNRQRESFANQGIMPICSQWSNIASKAPDSGIDLQGFRAWHGICILPSAARHDFPMIHPFSYIPASFARLREGKAMTQSRCNARQGIARPILWATYPSLDAISPGSPTNDMTHKDTNTNEKANSPEWNILKCSAFTGETSVAIVSSRKVKSQSTSAVEAHVVLPGVVLSPIHDPLSRELGFLPRFYDYSKVVSSERSFNRLFSEKISVRKATVNH